MAAEARRARVEELPACHRPAAIAALASEERGPPPGAAVVMGCCDAPERPWLALDESSPCLRPGALMLRPSTSDGLPRPTQLLPPGEVPQETPTPPPRLA
jgi:hypothetical protein